VSHDVALAELHEADALDPAQQRERLDQTAGLVRGQVGLRDVARHDRLALEAEPRQEHLHLLARRVLRLVEDHEGVVQGAAAHEGERRHLDHAALHQPHRLLEVHHVAERVVERPQIGIHLLGHRAGEIAELLARLDGRTRQHHARDLVAVQRRDRHRHREIGLAGAGRPDCEHHVALAHQVDVVALRQGLGADAPARADVGEHVLVDVAQIRLRLGREHADRLLHVARADRVAAAQHAVQLLEHAARHVDLRLRPDETHLVAARARVDAELSLEDAQVPIAFAVESGRSGVVVEDQGAAGRGVSAQWRTSRSLQCSGASRISPSARRAE
jgi:hypothetical protein